MLSMTILGAVLFYCLLGALYKALPIFFIYIELISRNFIIYLMYVPVFIFFIYAELNMCFTLARASCLGHISILLVILSKKKVFFWFDRVGKERIKRGRKRKRKDNLSLFGCNIMIYLWKRQIMNIAFKSFPHGG